jgi:hypothetical protein
VSTPEIIDDLELVLRRIPPGQPWQAPGPRITNVNFKPRLHLGETEVSVSRKRITSPDQLLAQIDQAVRQKLGADWRIAEAPAGDIRKLGFEVVADPQPHDPGHALIISDRLSLEDASSRRLLAALFQFVAIPRPSSD